MSVVLYETLFLMDPTRMSTEGDTLKTQLHTTIERYGATIDISRPWGDKKLTFPIRNQKKGSFYIIYYRMESTKQQELERDFAINENIFRQMTVKVDPKWENEVLEVARNDHGTEFAVRGMKDEVMPGDPMTGMGMPMMDGDGGPPPPRRRRSEGSEKPD